MNVLSLRDMRKLSDGDLLAYAELMGSDEAAWDELAERGCERQFGTGHDRGCCMNAQHTPTPWTHGFHDGTGCANDEQGGWILAGEHAAIEHPVVIVQGGKDEWGVPQGVVKLEDAAHIVKCVNSHDALVAALKLAESFIGDSYADTREPEAGRRFDIIRAALAAAGEGA